MGILDVFNKEKRELWLAKAEHDQLLRERRALLNSFRKNAYSELSFKYPDAIFLSNGFHQKFILHIESSGDILVGEYADYYAPFLHYIAPDARLAEWRAANADYRRQADKRFGVVSVDKLDKLKNRRRFLNEVFVNGFQHNGFAVTTSFESKYLMGGALFLNGRQIALSSFWAPKPVGYFAEQIYNHVVRTKQRTSTGYSSLVFVMFKCHTNYPSSKYHYEIIFGNGDDLTGAGGANASYESIIGLRNFLSSIEKHFVEPEIDGCSKEEFFSSSDKDLLESPEPAEIDKSIESDFPFSS